MPRLVATVPIGERPDGAAFDPASGRAFSANGEGSLTVVQEAGADYFHVTAAIQTQPGARTLALDPESHLIYLVSASFGQADGARAPRVLRCHALAGACPLLCDGNGVGRPSVPDRRFPNLSLCIITRSTSLLKEHGRSRGGAARCPWLRSTTEARPICNCTPRCHSPSTRRPAARRNWASATRSSEPSIDSSTERTVSPWSRRIRPISCRPETSREGWVTGAHSGVAYLINHAPGAESNWFVGALIQRQIGQQLRLGLEVFHRSRPSLDLPSSAGFNVGGTYDLDKHHHLLFSTGCGLLNRQQTNKASMYFAYQITG